MRKIAICVTTRNRPDHFFKWSAGVITTSVIRSNTKWMRGEWEVLPLVVVDDASDDPYTNSRSFRFPSRVGIPTAKNKCLEIAMRMGADDIFLFDDDCYPVSDGWCLPYLESPFPHLCYTFLPKLYTWENHTYYELGNGCMMYIRREVVEKIGGFDTRFGLGTWEHTHFSNRAWAAKLIPEPFIDVEGSEDLLFCEDQLPGAIRSFTEAEKQQLLKSGQQHFYETRFSKEYISYE